MKEKIKKLFEKSLDKIFNEEEREICQDCLDSTIGYCKKH